MSASDAQEQQGSSLYAALARTATRTVGLYFSRPVRLFRPSKVSGWQSLKGYATYKGHTFGPQFIRRLVKKEGGFKLIVKHFIPPIAVNALLGTVLWASYAEAYSTFEPYLGDHPALHAAASGAVAGGTQAIIGAPAENVRLVIEGGTGNGWSHAWKEVFRGTEPARQISRVEELNEARQVRDWMRDVRDMAGRGWDGWGFGFIKDVCGFAVFFSIFEITRRVSIRVRTTTQTSLDGDPEAEKRFPGIRKLAPRVIHATTLVSGGAIAGLAYEMVCRPIDHSRRAYYLQGLHEKGNHSIIRTLSHKSKEDGVLSFFKDPSSHLHESPSSRPRLQAFLRTIARVGPWGVGFLVWESLGPGLS